MVKKKITTTIVKEIKGTLEGIDNAGLHIRDEKTGKLQTIAYDMFEEFMAEEITLVMKKTEKEEIIIDGEAESCCDCQCSEDDCNCIDDCNCAKCKDLF